MAPRKKMGLSKKTLQNEPRRSALVFETASQRHSSQDESRQLSRRIRLQFRNRVVKCLFSHFTKILNRHPSISNPNQRSSMCTNCSKVSSSESHNSTRKTSLKSASRESVSRLDKLPKASLKEVYAPLQTNISSHHSPDPKLESIKRVPQPFKQTSILKEPILVKKKLKEREKKCMSFTKSIGNNYNSMQILKKKIFAVPSLSNIYNGD